MEDEMQISSEIPVMKVDTEDKVDPIKVTNGDLPQVEKEGKKEEDETDGEFIKVEKESLDVKDASHTAEAVTADDEKPLAIERSLSNSTRELLEAQEKVKELELELGSIAGALKHSESENTRIKEEILLAKEKLEVSEKKYEELELDNKQLQQQMIEAEEKYSLQLHTLQEALQAQDTKHKELIEVKEAFDGLSLDLENLRKRMQQLEQELHFSEGEAKRFEELHKQSGSHAESETQKALEFERLLEEAKSSAKAVEDQMASLQEEVKGLYEKIAENQKVEEALKSTTAELSAVNEELVFSKSQLQDMEQRLSSKEVLVSEFTQELDLRKASESKVKEDILALETLLSATKEDLQAKVSELEGIKLKLQEEVNTRELVEARLQDQKGQVSTVQEELAKVIQEKEALEAIVTDLTSNAARLKELCSDLEDKLKLSDENFFKADSLLTQALSNNAELEQKLKSLEDLHSESGAAAASATQKNLELEDLIQASNDAAENAKSQLRELETRFLAAEQRNLELEQQLNLVELKSSDAEREVREFSVKISELSAALKELEEEKKELSDQKQEYKEKITLLESSLNLSSSRGAELEEELRIAKKKGAELEEQANMNHQRSIELEDLFQTSHSKVEDASKKVNELELLLEAEKYRIQELEDQISTLEKKCVDAEEQISTLEKKCVDAELESNKYLDKVSELSSEIEAFQVRASSLEIAIQTANEKERELTECLNSVTDENKRLEDASSDSSNKLAEAENLVEVLRNEVNVMQEKLEVIENDLQAAGLRESDVMVKLKSAEAQLEQQEKLIEQATARKLELESLHKTLARDSEIKLQEVIANFTNKDSEAKLLVDKLKILEDQVKLYEEQVAEAAGKSASLKEELDLCLLKVSSLETSNEELKQQILEAESKASNSFSENELLVEANNQLKSKVDELQELLNFSVSEKEVSAQQIASHISTITEISDKHSRALELHSTTEARMVQAETELQETIQRLVQRDVETKDLNEKLNVLEDRIKLYEQQAYEASAISDTRKLELEETHLKLKHLESIVNELQAKSSHFETESGGLADANLKLTQELAVYESKLSDLEAKLFAAHAEKNETVEQLHTSNKAIEDLTRQLTDEGQKLQSQIFSVMEENNLLNETYQNAKKELQSVIIQLEEQLKEQKANEDALKSEIKNLKVETAEKSALQVSLEDLEKKLTTAEARLKEEVESVQAAAARREAELTLKIEDHANKIHDRDILNDQVLQLQRDLQLAQSIVNEQKEANSQKDLEREAALKKSLEDLESKNKEIILLEKQVKELEQKLQLADEKLLEKGDGGILAAHKDGTEIKSRDIGLTFSTPTKRKSKKKLEAASAVTSFSSEALGQTAEASPAMHYKFILGVALVSIIFGIILGKRY